MRDDVPPCNVLLVYPRFNAASFWNYRATCEAAGAAYPAAPLGLLTVAALLPEAWNIRLIDRNAQELTVSDIDQADLVMTGGMLPQQPDALEVVALAQSRGKPVAVGGPDVTSSPHIYECADYRVLGEAEGVIDEFVAAWNSGHAKGTFEAEKFTADVTKSPIPRFELLDFGRYLHVGVQFSRGCPFKCEFCDIIELYGRVPRTKTNEQMLAELGALYDLGYRGHVDFVDDNLIGNKKALKLFLPSLIAWQEQHGFPFEFSTEASLNLADDDDLLAMLRRANFFIVFVGIESPDTATLIGAQKKQNTRRSISASVHKVYDAGIAVHAGFIIGFDNERGSIAEPMTKCIEDASIPVCMVGLLYALPTTQLTRRLAREGRLHRSHDKAAAENYGDQCTSGLNFETARPRKEILSDYLDVLDRIYSPAAYFSRVRNVARVLDRNNRKQRVVGARGPFRLSLLDIKRGLRLLTYATLNHPRVMPQFVKSVLHSLRHNPLSIRYVFMMLGLYLHLGPFSREVTEILQDQIAALDQGHWRAPELVLQAS